MTNEEKLGSLSDEELADMTKEFFVLNGEGRLPDNSKVVEFAKGMDMTFDAAIRRIKDEAMYRWTMPFIKEHKKTA